MASEPTNPGTVSAAYRPLILTARMEPRAQAHFQRLRDAYFPPERNVVPAHVTLFHHLPGTLVDDIAGRLKMMARATRRIPVEVVRVRSLGRGVAYDLRAPELEALRDELAESLRVVRGDLTAIAERQEAKRLLIERMLLAPGKFKWVRVTNADIGEPGCKSWHVRPRLGLIGMLAGWWHVKISSGCPRPVPG